MGSWFDNNIQKTHGPRISKEMAEALGVFDKATGLRRKPDGSLEVLWSADTPKDQKTIQPFSWALIRNSGSWFCL